MWYTNLKNVTFVGNRVWQKYTSLSLHVKCLTNPSIPRSMLWYFPVLPKWLQIVAGNIRVYQRYFAATEKIKQHTVYCHWDWNLIQQKNSKAFIFFWDGGETEGNLLFQSPKGVAKLFNFPGKMFFFFSPQQNSTS